MSTATEYRSLLAKFAPRPIRSKADYQRVLTQLEKLMVPHPSAARSWLIEVLTTLMEKYESRDYPTPQMAPPEILAHLLTSRGVKTADVAKETDIPAATLSNVLAHRRGISKSSALKLGRYFGLSPLVFLLETEHRRSAAKPERAAKTSSAHG